MGNARHRSIGRKEDAGPAFWSRNNLLHRHAIIGSQIPTVPGVRDGYHDVRNTEGGTPGSGGAVFEYNAAAVHHDDTLALSYSRSGNYKASGFCWQYSHTATR